jgi:trans-aconitate methyltransferase
MHVPIHRRILSFFKPVFLRRSPSPVNGPLDLVLFCNRYLLLASDCLYSEDDRYLPAVAVADHLQDFLPSVRAVLVLGAGLGSVVRVLQARGCDPRFTLVDKDRTILDWAREILGDGPKLGFVAQDAESFVGRDEDQYDLVFVDIFKGRTVPEFATSPLFLRRCRARLSPGGRLALNYMEIHKPRWRKVQDAFSLVFPGAELVARKDNGILIG